MVNSRDKGCRGERKWRDILKEKFFCLNAHRGRQYSGGPDSPDVCQGIPGTHVEVKFTEKLSLYKAINQASGDAGEKIPYVAHKRSRKDWLVIVKADDLYRFAKAVVEQVECQQRKSIS